MACRARAYSMYDGMIHTSRLSPCALRISAHRTHSLTRIDSLGVSDALLDQTAPLVVEPLEEGHHLLRGHREEQIAHRDDAYRVVAVDLAILERLVREGGSRSTARPPGRDRMRGGRAIISAGSGDSDGRGESCPPASQPRACPRRTGVSHMQPPLSRRAVGRRRCTTSVSRRAR